MNDPPKKIKKFKKTIDKLKNKCYTMYVIKVRQEAKKGIDTMTKKITKKEMFAQILTHLTDENEIAFINHEIELLNHKASGTRKPTANQVANENFKHEILEVLNASDKAMTITEIQENSEALGLLTNQRISALLTQLKADNLVERIVDKRKAMFRVVGE